MRIENDFHWVNLIGFFKNLIWQGACFFYGIVLFDGWGIRFVEEIKVVYNIETKEKRVSTLFVLSRRSQVLERIGVCIVSFEAIYIPLAQPQFIFCLFAPVVIFTCSTTVSRYLSTLFFKW